MGILKTQLTRWCRPDVVAASVLEIDLALLRARGIEALLLDLDNTLTRWRSREVRAEVLDWVRQVRAAGFQVHIVSNAGTAPRVEHVARQMGVPFLVRAAKPRRRGFRRAAKLLNVPAERVAVVGDQIFTDVLGGKRAGMFTILVDPIDRRCEFISTRFMRLVERALFRHIDGEKVSVEAR